MGALGIVVAASPAFGQAPADQYIPSPKPADSGGSQRDPAGEQSQATASPEVDGVATAFGTDSQPPSGGGGPGGGTGVGEEVSASGGGDDGSGATDDGGGYPLTPFTTAVLGILALGLLAGLVAGARGRVRGAA